MRLAFFDSGIGGLTVVRQALAALPAAEYIYYADTAHAPYGTRSAAAVRARALVAADFLEPLGPDALVVACNTATSVAIQPLRARLALPVVGMEPAVKPALADCGGGRLLLLATSLTLRAGRLDDLIAHLGAAGRVDRRALDGLVAFAERFDFDSPRVHSYLEAELSSIDWRGYGAVVLGCTHFIFYRHLVQRLAGADARLLDGNAGTIRQLLRVLDATPEESASRSAPEITFYDSGELVAGERAERMQALLQPERIPKAGAACAPLSEPLPEGEREGNA